MNHGRLLTALIVSSALAFGGVVRAQAPSPSAPPPAPPPAAPIQPAAPAPRGDVLTDAETEALLGDDALLELETVEVKSSVVNTARIAGSAQTVDQKTLEKLEYDDPHTVLTTLPGVYVRNEDSFGLRPNIGIRGAASDRSKKITLMEDGVLMGPASYAAPAAYYFPLMTRITGVEVWKGPSAILFGPNTIGGAINLRSRDVPDKLSGQVDLAGGMYWYGKAHGWVGASHGAFGVLLEGVHLESDGFKRIDGGGDTGFARNDIRLKVRVQSDPGAELFQKLEGLVGYETEASNETYLGLTDADFRADPNRRYLASAQDRMEWWRTNFRLRHELAYEDLLTVTTTAYRNDFSRGWRKLNRFRDGPSVADVLDDPTGQRLGYYNVLTGAEDTMLPGEALMIGLNQRDFVSQGIQTRAAAQYRTGAVAHRPELGLRLHYDSIDRTHTEDPYLVTGGELVREGTPTLYNVVNTAKALAFAAHLRYEVEFWRLTLSPGARVEVIQTDFTDDLAGATVDRTDTILLPGLGAFLSLADGFGLLAGVYEGFSPVAPGQDRTVKEERSVNYELGARYQKGATQLEAVGFFNDYSNLTGECGFSTGCDERLIGQQFNGGEVNVWGVELLAGHTFKVDDVRFPARLAYTFTRAEFLTSFVSENPEFGAVQEGDAVPYVPEHQASLSLGVERDGWSATVVSTYFGEMREEASQGDDGRRTDDYLMIDVAAEHELWKGARLYLRVDNLLGVQPITARRPFGARPAKPLLAQVGVKLDF